MFIKLVGKLLKIVGKIFKRSDVYFLGHYLEGSGKYLKLWENYYPVVLKEFNCQLNDWRHIRWASVNNDYISFLVPSGNDGILYNTLGKFKIRIGNGFLYLEDVYEFYPWCGNYDHFNGCNCSDNREKTWGRLFREFYSNRVYLFLANRRGKSQKIYKLLETHKKINLKGGKIIITLSIYIISISICDSFWVEMGKPFPVLAKIPLQ